MKSKLSILSILFAAVSGVVLIAQSAGQSGRIDADVSTNQPQRAPAIESAPIKDDAAGRYQALREALGGDLSLEFIEAMMTAADAQRTQYGPDGRGAIRVGGSWTNGWPTAVR